MQQLVNTLADAFFGPITRHLEESIITERRISFCIRTTDALDNSIQNGLQFRFERPV